MQKDLTTLIGPLENIIGKSVASMEFIMILYTVVIKWNYTIHFQGGKL